MTSNPGHPWSADRPLDTDMVESLLSAAVPDVSGPVRYIGEGWDNQVFARGEWFFRFPKRREVEAMMRVEFATSPILAKSLDTPTPDYVYQCESQTAFPYIFGGYRKVPGTPIDQLEDLPNHAWPALADDLAVLLDQLANCTDAVAEMVDVTTFHPEEALDEAEAGLDLLEQHLSDDRFARWSSFCADQPLPEPWSKPPVYVHNDLFGDHILVDRETFRLSGVIDFADQELGDPVLDLVGIGTTFDLQFAIDLASRVTAWKLDQADIDRLIYLSAIMPMRWACNAIQRGEQDVFEHHADLVDAAIDHAYGVDDD